jgi:hypothetical protein
MGINPEIPKQGAGAVVPREYVTLVSKEWNCVQLISCCCSSDMRGPRHAACNKAVTVHVSSKLQKVPR